MSDLYKVLEKELLNKEIKVSISVDGKTILSGFKNKDIIGSILQSTVFQILKMNNIDIRENEKTQEFPDFFSSKELIEVKCYDSSHSPAFDVANFEALVSSLTEDPKKRINARYLVFGYEFDDKESSFKVTKMYDKKLHELCSKRNAESKGQLNLPLKCQVKRSTIHNIRPINSFDLPDNDQRVFKTAEELIEKIGECKEISDSQKHIKFNKKQWVKEVLQKLAA